MAIGCEYIEPAVQIVIEKEETEFKQFLAGFAEALLARFVREEQGIALGNVESIHFIGEVADGDSKSVVVSETRAVDTHRAPRQPICIIGAARARSEFVTS